MSARQTFILCLGGILGTVVALAIGACFPAARALWLQLLFVLVGLLCGAYAATRASS